MSRARVLVVAWVIFGLFVWSAVFDWWMSGAVREFLFRTAEYELGRQPEPSLADLMSEARRSGVVRASTWTAIVVGAGLLTIRLLTMRERR